MKMSWRSLSKFSLSATLVAGALVCPSISLGAPAIGAIYSPVAAQIDLGGPGFGSIDDTFNQSGLEHGFTSGASNFASYNPASVLHTILFSGAEWFSNQGTSHAIVTYDLGAIIGIDKLALWNEESSGIGRLNLLTSSDGVHFSMLAAGLVPTNWPLAPYAADVFSFGAVTARYVRFDMSGCPQPNTGSFAACAIGEVAFEVASVPEPSNGALMVGGLGLLGLMRRRRAV